MSALNGGIAAIFGAAFGGLYLPGIVYRVETAKLPGGKVVEANTGPFPCRYQPERITQAMRDRDGFTDQDARFLVLQASLDGPLRHRDQMVTDTGAWTVVEVEQDPARSYWDVHATPARRAITAAEADYLADLNGSLFLAENGQFIVTEDSDG